MSLGFLAMSNSTTIPKETIDMIEAQLRRDEGCVLYAYSDSEGLLTIGYGRMIDKTRGGGISQAEAEILLSDDVAKAAQECLVRLPWSRGLGSARFGALVNMAFNLGIAGLLTFTTFLGLMSSGEYEKAAADLRTTLAYKQDTARYERLAKQIETDTWQ